ncbi:plastid-lipid associated protein PAP [Actinidia rufa]|uniref:Plastid-lipid associated protein PAP n=1 Tax=Actinidia rufa TaxID=165716 RepID=A0A7J0DE07_9ERIC|nr:plastid-lipid associated protein PAP [Actinidia rufa]
MASCGIQIEYNELDLENKKQQLLSAIQDTQRGLMTSAHQRSFIEEALVSLETYHAAAPFDLGKLDGTWRLQYTSAPDVLILLESAATFPIFQVGQIFQKFECKNESDGVPHYVFFYFFGINICENFHPNWEHDSVSMGGAGVRFQGFCN